MATTDPQRLHRALAVVLVTGLIAVGCTGGNSQSSPSGDEPSPTTDIYSFAGSCRRLITESTGGAVELVDGTWKVGEDVGDGGAAAPFFMQATALGRYLLYGPRGQMIAAVGGDAIGATTEPGPPADWTLSADGSQFVLTSLETGLELAVGADGQLTQAESGDNVSSRWTFDDTTGCDRFPDISPGATGEPFVGEGTDKPVRGFFDAHTHVSAFSFLGGSFHCGRPWSPYGVTVALTDCPDHIEGGVGVTVESLFSNGSFDGTHATDGWPTFEGWPKPDSLTHEGTYWRWIERAWRGGMRVLVNQLVDNRALCELYPLNDGTKCGDMTNVADQAAEMVELQDYIDAQFGGPGKGFFRLVDSPERAREVTNEGKLAVVLGVEVSEVLDCGLDAGAPTCDENQIDAGLDELEKLGVRSVFPVHKFDNALGGTAYDGGVTGLIVNLGNRYATGEWWNPGPCEPGAEADNTTISPEGTLSEAVEPVADVFGDAIAPLLEGDLPTYGPAPHCNPRGLTDLGAHMINAMIDRHMIVETDHMSVRTRADVLDILEQRGYSGLITSHGWGDGTSQRRLAALGGVVAPYASSLPGFVDDWRTAKATASPDYLFGIGFGTDTNGLGAQPNARDGSAANPVEYPYTTFDGATVMDKQVSGERTFDVNTDGVAHYGMFPDWIEDMRVIAGSEIVDDLAQGAEAYLQMWERAEAHQ